MKPLVARTPLHTRAITFRGYAREDGLWDLEGELHDSKHYDYDSSHGFRRAGTPVHHLSLRVTVDDTFWRMHRGRPDHEKDDRPAHGARLAPGH